VSFDSLKAPTEDGDWLAHPDPSDWRTLLYLNVKNFNESQSQIGGRRWAEWRAIVRSEIKITGKVDGPVRIPALVVTGHQPDFIHPGVWIKNFAASGFAASIGGRALHVVTDNDLLKRTTVAVPAGTLQAPLVAHLPFDEWGGEEPFEERLVRNEETFRSFPDRVEPYLNALSFETLFPKYWRFATACNSRLLARRVVQPKTRLEEEWGVAGDETILSQFAHGWKRGFFLLAADVMLRAGEYADIYNDELVAFRRTRRIRGTHHPAPALEDGEHGVEVPFWAWKPGGRRLRPYIHRDGARLILSAGYEAVVDVVLPERNPVDALCEKLIDTYPSWRIRPRALMTTAFLRLGLADFFIHGLGGAKYDVWNDAVIRRFWNIEPPHYGMITATLRLPLGDWSVDPSEKVRELQRRRRELEWNPERFIDDDLLEREPICDWVEEKAALQESAPPTSKERKARYRRFRQLNERLREFVSAPIQQTAVDLEKANAKVDAYSLMGSREFFFGFHPVQSLKSLLLPWLDWSQPKTARRPNAGASV
jgi:hypothetical protein